MDPVKGYWIVLICISMGIGYSVPPEWGLGKLFLIGMTVGFLWRIVGPMMGFKPFYNNEGE